MPNLVVYVPARVARALEVKGVSEDIQRRACKEVLVGLADGELGEGVARAAVPSHGATPSQSAAAAPSPSSSASPDPVSRESGGGPVRRAGSKCSADVARGTRCKLCGEKH